MFDDKKSDAYELIPDRYLPETILANSEDDIINLINKSNLEFPLILKPDVGFKGYLVMKLNNLNQLINVLPKYDNKSILIQEFIDFKKEYSVLLYRYPISGQVGISSLIEKTYPTVIGDGQKTLKELIDLNENPFLQKEWIKKANFESLHNVLKCNEERRIDDIGNYSRGASFHSLNHQINEDMVSWAKDLLDDIQGIDFCRIDLKSDSIKNMIHGKFKIIEINGAKSEPLHTYDKSWSYLQIMKDVHKHWMIIRDIVKERLTTSYSLPSFFEGYKSWRIAHNLIK